MSCLSGSYAAPLRKFAGGGSTVGRLPDLNRASLSEDFSLLPGVTGKQLWVVTLLRCGTSLA